MGGCHLRGCSVTWLRAYVCPKLRTWCVRPPARWERGWISGARWLAAALGAVRLCCCRILVVLSGLCVRTQTGTLSVVALYLARHLVRLRMKERKHVLLSTSPLRAAATTSSNTALHHMTPHPQTGGCLADLPPELLLDVVWGVACFHAARAGTHLERYDVRPPARWWGEWFQVGGSVHLGSRLRVCRVWAL